MFTILQWVPFTFVNCLVIAVIVIVVFAIIWLIMYLMWKNEVQKMNEDLKAYRERE